MISLKNKEFMLIVLLITIFVSFFITPSNGNAEIDLGPNIIINGKKLDLDVKPVTMNGRIYVPVRAILEHLGMVVTWDQASETVMGKNSSSTLIMPLKESASGESTYNGVPFYNEQDSNIALDGRSLVPVRTVGSLLGLNVKWDRPTNNVILTDSYIREIGLKEAYERVKSNNILIYDKKFKYVHLPFGGYAGHDNYVLDNYYVFSVNSHYGKSFSTWTSNICVDKQTGEMKVYMPKDGFNNF